jgi:hypothetical protein
MGRAACPAAGGAGADPPLLPRRLPRPAQVALNHKGARFVAGSRKPGGVGGALKCGECGQMCSGEDEAAAHASATGHTNFAQV